jgi:hypothetical protein
MQLVVISLNEGQERAGMLTDGDAHPKSEVWHLTSDLAGFHVEEACQMLRQAGYQVTLVTTGNPGPLPARVLRLRQLSETTIEVTQATELYTDPGAKA